MFKPNKGFFYTEDPNDFQESLSYVGIESELVGLEWKNDNAQNLTKLFPEIHSVGSDGSLPSNSMEIRFNPMGVNYALYVFDWEKFCAYLQEHSAGAHDAASVHIHIKRLKDCHRLRQLIGNNMDTFFKLSLKPSQNSYWRSPLNDSITSRTLIRATPQTTEFRMFHSSNTAEGYIYYIQLVLEMLRYNEDTELGMVDWISSLKDSAYPLVRKNARRVLNDNQK